METIIFYALVDLQRHGENVVDFFEMDRVLDELARTFAAPSATTWFKVTRNKSPTRDEYRLKVIEFMNLFENALSTVYQDYPNSDNLLDHVKRGVEHQAKEILSGKNKEVEKKIQVLRRPWLAFKNDQRVNFVRNYYFCIWLFLN